MNNLYKKKEKVNQRLEKYIEKQKEALISYLVQRTNYERVVKDQKRQLRIIGIKERKLVGNQTNEGEFFEMIPKYLELSK